MNYCISLDGDYIVGVFASAQRYDDEISESHAKRILTMLCSCPTPPIGCTYKLRADTLEWELVELPPVVEEPLTDEEALTRYINEITGANDPDLISAAETLITERIKEES